MKQNTCKMFSHYMYQWYSLYSYNCVMIFGKCHILAYVKWYRKEGKWAVKEPICLVIADTSLL